MPHRAGRRTPYNPRRRRTTRPRQWPPDPTGRNAGEGTRGWARTPGPAGGTGRALDVTVGKGREAKGWQRRPKRQGAERQRRSHGRGGQAMKNAGEKQEGRPGTDETVRKAIGRKGKAHRWNRKSPAQGSEGKKKLKMKNNHPQHTQAESHSPHTAGHAHE